MYSLQELGLDEELFLAEAFFRGEGGVVAESRAEETGGDTAKSPVGLQGPYDEGEGEEVLVFIITGKAGGDGVDRNAFLLPCINGYGKKA
jgi:hypothetical protein